MLVIISWLSDLKFGSPPPNKEARGGPSNPFLE